MDEPMADRTDSELQRIADAISEELPVDWDRAGRDHPEISTQLPALRLIEKIAHVHRTPLTGAAEAPGAEREPLFRWGPLQAVEKLGEGGYGTVWRAHDPDLQRDVALKLLHEEARGRRIDTARLLEEARRMARVRHENVVTIHGAAEHDGRAGFWSDLIHGTTLEAQLAASGPLGPGEAALVGTELCRALAAVHAAGLIHGDVKASNVMRDERGRILLMDFGAGSERDLAEGQPNIGTPITLAPEVFRGAPAGPATDIYALGILLFRLVSGEYPIVAGSVAELRARHQRGERTALLDLRPDLPLAFVRVVEQAIAPDPEQRFRSAGEMETALAGLLAQIDASATATSAGKARRLPAWTLFLAAGALITGAILLATRPWGEGDSPAPAQSPAVPAATGRGEPGSPAALPVLTSEATLCRSRGGAKEILAPGALVRPGDALFLELQCSQPAHAYVFNEDPAGTVVLLFPHPALDLTGPLEPGPWYRLPGTRDGELVDWEMAGGPGEEEFLVISSREPLPELETWIAALPVERNGRPAPGIAPGGTAVTRGVTALVGADAPAEGRSASRLAQLARTLSAQNRDPGGLWIRQFTLYNSGH
jgi:hypothetical protein